MVEAADGHGTEARFAIFGAYRALPTGSEAELLRIAQEAIQNVKKHAVAKHVSVRLEYGPDEIALEVRDDGRGFAASSNFQPPPGHYGLTGMRERAAAIGGTLALITEPGAGTSVRCTIPSRGNVRSA
jgi:signal transduction histidine kinase